MRNFYFLLFLVFTLCSYQRANAQEAITIPDKLVFKLKPQYKAFASAHEVQLEALNNALTSLQATELTQKYPRAYKPEGIAGAVDLTLIYQVKVNPSVPFAKAQRILLQTGMLEYAEQLRYFPLLYQPNDPMADSVATTTQYHLKKIKAYRGWDFEQGDTSIVIGILDTGIRYTHKDLRDNLKYNYADPIDGIDNDNDGYIDNFRGWDVADNDNFAVPNSNGHGIEVTGVVSATTNNNRGVAGVGFKCKFLPVKVYASGATAFSGYEGIVYAADHGCSIINLSWGGWASPSFYEQDVINYAAINRDIVLVAAAGNTNAKLDFYPSSYANVLAVAGLNTNNVKAPTGTYSHRIDLSAPGVSIRTTSHSHDSAYSSVGGSSFAAPMVAGTAALVKKKFPQYNAQQIAQRVRVTADPSIYSIAGNAAYSEMLGKGILDVAKALTATNLKSVRYTDVRLASTGELAPGDTIKVFADFKNYLDPLSNLIVTLTSPSQYVTVVQGNFAAGAMATLASATNLAPFRVYIKPNAPQNEKLKLRFTFSDGTYTDYQYYELQINPDYLTININELALTVTSKGNIGFQNMSPEQGAGARYKKVNLLSEGGFLIGNAPTTVSDNIRNATYAPDNNFQSLTNIHFLNTPPRADQEAVGRMSDKFPTAGNVGVQVDYKAYAWQNAPNDKFVVLEYKVRNNQAALLSNLYAGMFADWDIFDPVRNIALWDSVNRMGYVYNVRRDSVFAGIKLLSSGAPSYYAFDYPTTPAGFIKISDGFTDAEKFQALSGGVARKTAGDLINGTDASHLVGQKLPNLDVNDSTTVAFAIIAGDSFNDLKASAQAAQNRYDSLGIKLGYKDAFAKSIFRIYPNPVSENLQVELPADKTNMAYELTLVNTTGQTVAVRSGKAGKKVTFNVATLPAGLYFVRITNAKTTYTAKIQVLK